MVGKIFAQVVLEQLQTIAENILPESQRGVHKTEGVAIDMIFAAHQFVEKTREHEN